MPTRLILGLLLVASVPSLAGCDSAEREAARKARDEAEYRRFQRQVTTVLCGPDRASALSQIIEDSEGTNPNDSRVDLADGIADEIETKGCPAQAGEQSGARLAGPHR